MLKLSTLWQSAVHLIYPHNCTGCGTDVLDTDQQLCLGCIRQLPATHFFDQPHNPVEQIFYGRLPVRHAAAGYFFTKQSLLQHLIVQLKYRGNRAIGEYFGIMLGHALQQAQRFASVDVLVPLPLNPKRESRRGYNQATSLCRGIASVWPKPIIDNNAVRKIYTETQTHKGRINRWQNMDGVFAVKDPASLQGKHILLVDDVVTTGATLEACGTALLAIPGTTLSIATLAYTH